MKVLRNIITQSDIDSILLHYKDGEYDSYIKNNHGSDIDKLINYSNIHYCDKNNPYLRSIIENVVYEIDNIYSIHMLRYTEGDSCDKHKDRSSHNTYIFILTDEFGGGDLLIDGVDTEAKKGDVVVFNGSVEYHEVSKITYGIRDVLVVWTGSTRKKTTLI